MNWNPSYDMLLARHDCTRCHGSGRVSERRHTVTCACVLRSVFRACFGKFRQCVDGTGGISNVQLERTSGALRRCFFGRRQEEYMADFYLVSRRVLSDEEFRIFKYHFLLGAGWRMCCTRLGIDRGVFYHAVYRIQQRLGRAFRDTKPYALYPLDDYFHNAGRINLEELRSTIRETEDDGPRPLAPPLRRAA